MTSAERNIAERLRAFVSPKDFKEDAFIHQLRNWYDRDMTRSGRGMMMRLFEKYQRSIPDYQELRSAYFDEQLNKLAP